MGQGGGSVLTTMGRLLLLAFSLFCADSAFAARAVMEATPSTLGSIFISSTQARVGISSTTPTHTLSVGGDVNFSGGLYKNGVLFSGGGGGDNLGSHVATMTIAAGYGISATTISLTNTGNSITSAGGISVFANTSGLNNLGVFYFSQASNPYRMYLSDPTKTLSLVAGDGGKMSVLSTSGSELLGVKNNGTEMALVGISSTTPTHTLSVQGDINYSGTLYKNGVVVDIGGGGSGGGNTWVEQNFYSQTNGSQTQFTLSQVPTANSLTLSKNGVVLVSPADYSLTNQLITMVTAPASSTTLVANYAVSVATDIAAIKIDGQPIGTIIAYSTTTPPSGYLYCDGSYVSTTTYADLFAITGHRYSTYTVTGTPSVFQLPDLRGMFLRGALGNLNSRDPDGNRVVGSTQTDTLQGHRHNSNSTTGTGGGTYTSPMIGTFSAGVVDWFAYSVSSDPVYGSVRVSTETRPENIAVAYMIKYAHSGVATVYLASSTIVASSSTWTGSNTFTGAVSVSSITIATTNGIAFSNGSIQRVKGVTRSSGTYTGTGSGINIAHGCGATPMMVVVVGQVGSAAGNQVIWIESMGSLNGLQSNDPANTAPGSTIYADATNIVVGANMSVGSRAYKWVAFCP